MKKRSLKIKQWLFVATLTAMGFTSCDDMNTTEEQPLMYGTPVTKYSIKTKVINKAQQPVKGIEVILEHPNNPPFPIDTVLTNAAGEANLEYYDRPDGSLKTIRLNDIDGDTNGSYQNASDTVVFQANEVSKEITITLQQKNNE